MRGSEGCATQPGTAPRGPLCTHSCEIPCSLTAASLSDNMPCDRARLHQIHPREPGQRGGQRHHQGGHCTKGKSVLHVPSGPGWRAKLGDAGGAGHRCGQVGQGELLWGEIPPDCVTCGVHTHWFLHSSGTTPKEWGSPEWGLCGVFTGGTLMDLASSLRAPSAWAHSKSGL